MLARFIVRSRLAPALCAGALVGCAMPAHTTRLAGGPDPVEVEMSASRLSPGQPTQLIVRSPGADSIAFESANGVDRFWTDGPVLSAVLTSDFGDSVPVVRYAGRWHGQLLNTLKKPARIAACRLGRCREFVHEVAVALPERNQRSVALTAGWSSVFASRSIRDADRTVLFEEVLNSGIWTVQGEWAASGWNGKVQGFLGASDRGGSLDLSRVIKRSEGLSYGLAVHVGAARNDWLAERPNSAPRVRTGYRLSLGPSVMLRGVTASSQFGIHTDGVETLQIASTRISVNGNLTSVRHPITITAEKTFAFGGGAIIARRRDALERLTAAIRIFDDFGVNVGLSSHRIAWPDADPSDDLRASETLVTLGGQYSVTW
ncbi:MAG: hypothetical protein H0V43_12555 [Gemmatimonadales bacterium]|nr:hypothetical protein [Gemmatimonadales bacterium]MBA3556446.1 hypothetical protein [Gemmatimonadales bacterium]